MKTILVLAILLASGSAFAQVYGGINAHDPITLKITGVSNTPMPDHPFAGNIASLESVSSRACSGAACPAADQVIESSSTIKVTAVSSTAKYELSCTDSTVSYPTSDGRAQKRGAFTVYPNGGINWMPRCETFHVDDSVVFYSSDTLIWLTITHSGKTLVHPDCWKFDHDAMSCTWEDDLSASADLAKQFGVTQPRSRTNILWEIPYRIDSEHLKGAR